jgi:hypothetical protein
MTIYYEWDVELIITADTADNEAGEVLDHFFCGSYELALTYTDSKIVEGFSYRIVLVRDDDYRSWAYVAAGKLPTHFEDAYGNVCTKVPQRFINEFSKAHK